MSKGREQVDRELRYYITGDFVETGNASMYPKKVQNRREESNPCRR